MLPHAPHHEGRSECAKSRRMMFVCNYQIKRNSQKRTLRQPHRWFTGSVAPMPLICHVYRMKVLKMSSQKETFMKVNGYPSYRRWILFTAEINGNVCTHERVVPMNLHQLITFNCYVNPEIWVKISAVEYLYKYIDKEPNRVRIIIEIELGDGGNPVVDEIELHLKTRYVRPPQGLRKVFGFSMQEESHIVFRLVVHLPGFQNIQFVREQKFWSARRVGGT